MGLVRTLDALVHPGGSRDDGIIFAHTNFTELEMTIRGWRSLAIVS
jgi:hypothetical protein